MLLPQGPIAGPFNGLHRLLVLVLVLVLVFVFLDTHPLVGAGGQRG